MEAENIFLGAGINHHPHGTRQHVAAKGGNHEVVRVIVVFENPVMGVGHNVPGPKIDFVFKFFDPEIAAQAYFKTYSFRHVNTFTTGVRELLNYVLALINTSGGNLFQLCLQYRCGGKVLHPVALDQ